MFSLATTNRASLDGVYCTHTEGLYFICIGFQVVNSNFPVVSCRWTKTNEVCEAVV